MPLNRFLKLPEEEQERVLGVAKKQFALHGYDAMSLNLLLKELEISKGQFYYWFEDKADLFLSIIGQYYKFIIMRLEEHGVAPTKEDYWVHLRQGRLIQERCWVEFDPDVEIGTMLANQMRYHPLSAELETKAVHVNQYWLNQFKQGQEWGLVRTDLSLELLLQLVSNVLDSFYGIMFGACGVPTTPNEAQVLHSILGSALRGLLENPQGASAED
jgi:AcrR family transcriptional regulator